MRAQTIEINNTFTSDEVIFPFEGVEKIYGISVSGSVNLYSDTSLVRVIYTDNNGMQWMVYEAYPLIVNNSYLILDKACDESCFLDESITYSITIQIIAAEIFVSTLNINVDYRENNLSLQYQAKRNKDQAKVQQMNANIQARGWNWTASDNEIVEKFYTDKRTIFSNDKFNMQGFDYYQNGVFKYISRYEILPDSNSLLPKSFDWRSKHDATTPGSKYDFGPNGWITPLNQVQGNCGSCWAFASVSAVESVLNLFYNDSLNYDLSQQDILCNTSGDCFHGGTIYQALTYFISPGVILENCLAYGAYDKNSPKCNDSLCNNPSHQVKINNQYSIGGSTNDDLKEYLMTFGPIPLSIELDTHSMCLVGYEVNQNFITNWIFKNSWYIENVYVTMPASTDAFNSIRIIGLPVWDISDTLEHKCLDRDKDGYYNWGIKIIKPETCPQLCSDEKDWNDNNNRIGPADINFNGLSVAPAMQVSLGSGLFGSQINNGDLVMIAGDSANDITYSIQLKNTGTAQLNLKQNLLGEGIVEIEYQYPTYQFQLFDPPENSICMNNDTTTFRIKMFQGAQTGSLAHIHIHLNEPDMDPIFEFTLVYNGCETLPGYDSMNSLVEWSDTCRAQCKDLHIQRNGMLIIKDTVMLSPDADIIIEPGGKLILDGGKLTRLCNNELWNGIQVWGDSSLSQYGDTNQGYLGIRNGGIIEYAVTGAFVGKIIDGDTLFAGSGGIVEAEDAIFLNNETDVEFLPFINDHPSNGNEMPNISVFRNSTFKTCDPDGLIGKVKNHVLLDGVNGVDFYACSFLFEENEGQHIADADRGAGIYALDAQVYVKGRCTSQSTPCTSYDSCYFKNLRYGIRAFCTGGFQYLDVSESVFDENTAGIYLSGYHHPAVVSSHFTTGPGHDLIPGQENAFYGGLYMDGSSGYVVENNSFVGPNTTVPNSGSIIKIGIYVKNSGNDDNEIYNNYFIGLDAGIVAEGINKGKETGLCLKCNDFRTCLNDMMVTDSAFSGRGRGAGIKENQGTEDTLSYMLAGNTFTPEVQAWPAVDHGGKEKYFWSYYNNADHFKYYHHGYNPNFVTYPEDSINYSYLAITFENKFVPYEKAYACPKSPSSPGYKNTEDPRSEKINAEIQLAVLQNTYYSLLDGGNTEDLAFEIITSMPDEALELRDQLLTDSPYLSDTILKQAIYKETVLPNAMIRDVLTANPQSAKSGDVLDALDGRYDPMPDYMMAEIMQGRNQIGALESLESKIGYWSNYRSQAINKLIREFLSDTTLINPEDSLIHLFLDEPSLESRYRLIFAFLKKDQVEQAQNALTDLPLEFGLSTTEQEIYTNYVNYFDVLSTMKDSNQNIRNLDSSQVQDLISIMNSNLPLISTYARGLLMKGRHINFMESVSFSSQVKSYPDYYYHNLNKTKLSEEENLVVYPNPCGEFVIVYYNTTTENRLGALSIIDIQGKELNRIKLNYLRNQLTLNLSYYPTGVYIISLIVDEKLISSKKLSKARK
jgi:C1A family cysteine protease